jgi:cysteine desulfurase
MDADMAHVVALEKRLRESVFAKCPDVYLNGPADLTKRYPGNVNLSFDFVEGESLLMGLRDIAVSSGSACTSASLEPSYVLRALGVDDAMAHSSIRFGIGRFTTADEVDLAVEQTVKKVDKLRKMSPLWEMVQDGVDLKSIQWSQH